MPGNPSTPRWAGGVPGGLVVTSAGSLSPLTVHRRYSASAQNRFAADAVASAAESALPGRAQHTNPRGLQLPVLDQRHPARGGVIDTSVNPTQLPPGTLAGPGRPQPQFNRSDLWAHGINLGRVFNF